METDYGEKKVWLVKSAGRILGPYSIVALKEKLKARKISILDEIRTPTSRWDLIRNQKQLGDLVEQIKSEYIFQDEDTDLISQDSSAADPIDVQYTELEDLPPPKPKKNSKIILLVFWFMALVAIFSSVSLVLFQSEKILSKKVARSYSEQDFMLGHYKQVLEDLNNEKTLTSAKTVRLALLQLQYDNQPIESRRTLEKLDRSKTDFSQSDVDMILGLSYMKEHNWNEAKVKFESIQEPSKLSNAKINLAIIDFMNNRYDAAHTTVQQLLEIERTNTFLPMLMGAALFHSEDTNKDKIKKYLADFSDFINRTHNFRIEFLLYKAALHLKLKEPMESANAVELLLKTNPQLTFNHIQNLWIDQQILKWDNLNEICTFVADQQEKAQVPALKALCLFKIGETGRALQLIESGRQQFADNNLLIPLHSFLLKELGQFDQALTLAKMNDLSSLTLLNVVAGEICLNKKDFTCADKYFFKTLDINPNDLDAITGLAKLNILLGKTSLANEFIKTGLEFSPHFQPLMELEMKQK